MKKKCTLILSLLLVLALLCACGDAAETGKTENTESAESAQPVKIRVAASPTPHAEILAVAKEILAAKDITLDIQEYQDYVVPNTVVEDGTVDANYFQHVPYLDDFNAQQGTHIVSVSEIHVEPMGVYGGKQSTLDVLK